MNIREKIRASAEEMNVFVSFAENLAESVFELLSAGTLTEELHGVLAERLRRLNAFMNG